MPAPRAARQVTRFDLNLDEVVALNKVLVGEGGFQSFGRELQNQITIEDDQSNPRHPYRYHIDLSDRQLGRCLRHMRYDEGGFESRLRKAFARGIREIVVREPEMPLLNYPDRLGPGPRV